MTPDIHTAAIYEERAGRAYLFGEYVEAAWWYREAAKAAETASGKAVLEGFAEAMTRYESAASTTHEKSPAIPVSGSE